MDLKQRVGSPHARLTLSDSLPCTAVKKKAYPIPHNLTASTLSKRWLYDINDYRAGFYFKVLHEHSVNKKVEEV